MRPAVCGGGCVGGSALRGSMTDTPHLAKQARRRRWWIGSCGAVLAALPVPDNGLPLAWIAATAAARSGSPGKGAALADGVSLSGASLSGASVSGASAPGARLLVQYQCVGCHRMSDVSGAVGRAGPTLERFGSRSYIAGKVPNTPALLARWIADPQALVPGTAMPDMGVTAADAETIAAFLGASK